MEEILYLEPDEEITSVIDKLKSLSGASVALVLPKNSQLAASVVNLKLIKREAAKQKKQISIVTQDKVGTGLANQVGIPVFASISDDQPVNTPHHPKPQGDEVIKLNEKKSGRVTEEDAEVPVHRYDASAPAHHQHESQAHELPSEQLDQPTTQQREVQSTHGRRSGLRLRRGPVLALLAALIVAALGWLLFLYPRATVVLGVVSEPIHETVTVTIDNNITEPSRAESKVPGQKVQVETTVKELFDSTGQKEVGQKATGQILLSNRLGETVAVPVGTVVARDNLEFVTTEEASIGAATVSLDASGNVLVKPGTKQVGVEAKVVGSASNLAAGDFVITGFSGAKRDRVTAQNSSAFAGGESHTVRVVTADDISNAKGQIGQKVNEQLVTELKGKAREVTVLGNTIQVEVVDAQANKAPDEEADQFELEAKVRARSIGFSASQYQAMVVDLVGATIPEDKELLVNSEDSVETQVKETKYDDGILVLESTLSSEVVQRVDEAALKRLIAGKTVLTAEQLLKEQSGIQTASITLRPSFKSAIPGNAEQILIQFDRQ